MSDAPARLDAQVYILAGARFFESVAVGVLIPILPSLVDQIDGGLFGGLSVAMRVGLIFGVFGLVTTVIQYPAGRLVDRHRRPLRQLLCGIAGFVLLTWSLTLITSYAALLVLRVAQAIVLGVMIPALWALLVGHTRAENRALGISLYTTVRLAGFAIGPLFGGLLNDHFGFRPTFLICAGLGAFSLLLLLGWGRDAAPEKSDQESGRGGQPVEFWVFSAAIFCLMFGLSMIISLFPHYKRTMEATDTQLALVFSAVVIVRVLTQLPMGWLADRYGRKRFIVGGLCVLAPALIWTGLARGLFGLIASRALQGLCSASIVAPLYALAGDKSPKGQRGRQMATVTMGFTAGIALGPLFSGWLAGQSILFPFGVAAAGSVAVALAIGLFVTEESVDVISAAP